MNLRFKTFYQGIFLIGAFLVAFSASAQMSYEKFHAKYSPHYNTLSDQYKAVGIMNESDASTGAAVIELLLQQADEGDEDSKLAMAAALTSAKRNIVAAALANMGTDEAVRALLYLKGEWQRELMWFVDKTTYHNIAPHLPEVAYWSGPQGPFGPNIGNWSPAYAGAGFDICYSFMAGLSDVLENYGEGNQIHAPLGFTAFAGFHTKNNNMIEIKYQNRSRSTGYLSPSATNMDTKYGMNTIGINFLSGKNLGQGKKAALSTGWGFQVNMNKWSTSNGTTGWQKAGSSITGGATYNINLFINPFKDIPVMIGLNTYAQFNAWQSDYNGLADILNGQAAGTNDNKDYRQVLPMFFGGQATVMYRFGKKEKDNFKSFDTELAENMDPHVNTAYTEILPVVSPDGHTLYFIRSDHPLNNKGSRTSQDVWVADVKNGIDNATATHLELPINAEHYNMIAGVSPDGNSMMIKGAYDSNGDLLKGYSMIYRTRDGWTKPENVVIKDYADMSKGVYVGAYWTQDGKHVLLSFSEEQNGTHQDLYVSHLQDDGTYSRPKNLGPKINTDEGDDHSPFLASDGKTLYYSSNRDGGLGNNDIWMTKRQDDSWTNWSDPVNLGDEVNTEDWDAYYSIDAQGKYAYLSSQKNSKGKEDIVRIKLKEEVQPDPVVLIRGKVLNAKTDEPLDANITYNGLDDGKNYGVARTNPATGEYLIVLPYGRNYDFTAGSEGYLGVSDNLDLTGIGEYQELERDLYLVPIEVGATVRLNNIFFETGKAELKSQSYIELGRVIKFLEDNPNVKIELSGHTDNVGDKTFNKNLSQKRADAVLSYLESKGVAADRVIAKGYGMEKPVADNDTEEGKALNRRVEFTILEN